MVYPSIVPRLKALTTNLDSPRPFDDATLLVPLYNLNVLKNRMDLAFQLSDDRLGLYPLK
jgi:hypothetical protein